MSKKTLQLKRLKIKATRGDRASQDALVRLNDEVAKEVNKRLRALERRGYDYYAYNKVVDFTQTMYEGSNRVKTAKALEYDWYMMTTQTEIGLQFLEKKTSTVEGQKEIEKKRMETFEEMGLIDEDMTPKKFRNFLKFLSEEASESFVDSWGNSEMMVDLLLGAYNKKENTKAKIRDVLNEYLEGTYDIYEAADMLGVDFKEYRKRQRIRDNYLRNR